MQLGVTQTVTTTVTGGLFTAMLNDSAQFGGSAFNGDARYLGIGVKCGSESNLTNLGRQALTAAPYALTALTALTATNAFSATTALTATNAFSATMALTATTALTSITAVTTAITATNALNAWALTGNSGTSASDFVGTTDNMTLTLAVSNTAALRLVPNATSPNVIGGWSGNRINTGVVGGTIAGGGENGYTNIVSGDFGTVSGGRENSASFLYATVGRGYSNAASSQGATVGGGINNTASGYAPTVGGGANNTASDYATVGGGGLNTANNNAATIGGGTSNIASNSYATIPGGWFNLASGTYSFAAGQHASAIHTGAFVWADNSTSTPISSTTNNQFVVRASGGITLYTDSAASAGVRLTPGSGTWASLSDRNVKANFAPVDGLDILNQLMNVSIQTWNYQTQDAAIRHIGPMAQDFYAVFKVGEDDTHITTIDAEGVALAAIQGLYQVVQEKDEKIAALEARVVALEQQSINPSPVQNSSSQLPWGWLLFGGLLLVNLGFLLGLNIKKGARL